jgi:enamine deaminase RidA (YjgF/YER057c/UK114 family)
VRQKGQDAIARSYREGDRRRSLRLMSHEARLRDLGIVLPSPPAPVATYVRAVRHGDTLYVSGTGPLHPDGTYVTGRLGADLDVAAGQQAARLAGLAVLATVRAHAGSLDQVDRVVKVLGFVRSTPDFGDHPKVVNGFSDLMVEVFGEAGLGARSAVGAPSLPSGIAVEVEAIFALRPR